jgi:hypothetical protein
MLLLLSAIAHAGTVEVWTYDSFPADQYLEGKDDWDGGYDADPWYGYELDDGDGWAFPITDHNDGDAPGDFGEGGAKDNWLVNPAVAVGDGVFTADFYSQDDDSLAIVIGHDDASNLYLFVLCGAARASGNCPFDLSSGTSGIVEIAGGRDTVLAQDRGSYSQYSGGTMSFSLNDGVLAAWSDDLGIDMSVEEQGLDHVDAVGFWAYDAGSGAGDTETYVAFGHPVLEAYDDDEDGVIDDQDACEFEAAVNDADGDGCEDPEGDADTDTDADADADADSDTDTDTDADADADADADTDGPGLGGGKDGGGLSAPGQCACDAGASSLAGLAPLLLAAAAARRRRRG